MDLQTAIANYSDDLDTIAEQIDDGVLDPDTEAALQAAFEDASEQTLKDLVDRYPRVADIQVALGLRPTMPPPPGESTTAEIGAEPEVEFLSEAEQDAIGRVEDLLERAPNRGFEHYLELAEALSTGNAAVFAGLTQDTINTLPEGDQERLAERAAEIRDQIRQEDLELDDFDGITRALERGGGRDVPYFRNVIAELRGEQGPQRVPADELDAAPQQVIESAIELAEAHIEDLQTPDREQRGGQRGGGGGGPVGDRLPGGGMGFDTGGSESFGARYLQDEDYMNGDPITRDLEFEERWANLVIRLGYRRKFDLGSGNSPEARADYFALTPENQRRYYDNTPQEFLAYLIRRGEVDFDDLYRLGFEDENLPDRDDI